jgi:hypothetical protein
MAKKKVYEIYSGSPKRWGLNVPQQIAALSSLMPPMWLQIWWLIPFFLVGAIVITGMLTKDDDNIFVRLSNFLLPNYIRGKFTRHGYN